MALISCPECKRMVSDRAEACIHCGYPLSAKEVVIDQSRLNTTSLIEDITIDFSEAINLFYNGKKSKSLDVILSALKPIKKKYSRDLGTSIRCYIGVYLYAFGEVPENVDLAIASKYGLNDIEPIIIKCIDDDRALTRGPLPTCPTCGSTTIAKLGVLDRAISFELVGFASNKIGKSFKCRNCGYTW